jgi:hypothetical protein
VVVLLLPACSDTADDSADTTLAATTTTTAAPTTTLMLSATTTAPTTTLDTPRPTTAVPDISPTIWKGPIEPITLTLDPPTVPAEIGVIDVTVTGRPYDSIWLMVCAGARGVVSPEDWPDTDTWNGDMAAVCGDVSRGSGTLVNPTIDDDGRFEAILRVPIDAQAIDDGGVVISAGDIWVVLRGNALLRIGPGDESSPWERFGQDHYNTSRLESVITNWGAFEFVFNAVYQEHEGCAQAYAEAQEARSGYLNVEWDHETQDKPGLEYDRLVARFTASERWLQVKGCPGAGDFTRVG